MKTKFILGSAALFLASIQMTAPTTLPVDNQATVATVQTPGFGFFRTHRQGKGVTATWGLTSNEGVAGFGVQRTYEDPSDPYAYWENLSSMPCTPSRSFKYFDESVFPGNISYRIIAWMEDGSSVTSPVSSVRIVSH